MRYKRIIYGICVVIMMGLIFLFSSQTYEQTMKTSNVIVSPIRNAIEENKSFENEKEEKNYSDNLKRILDRSVRKTAHMILFAVLSVFIYLLLKSLGLSELDSLIYTLVLSGIYAGCDELHQSFINGRDSQFIDVCVDEFGAVIGMVLTWLSSKIKNKRLQ